MLKQDQINIYIPVSEIFPNVGNDFKTFRDLLKELSRTDALFWCARLNLVLSSSSDLNHMERQQFGLNQFLTTEEINAVNAFIRKHRDARKINVFFRGQLLELIRWVALYCQDYPDDGMTFEDPEIRRKFVQAALIASDIWSKRALDNRLSLNNGAEIVMKKSLGAIRKSIEATSFAPYLYRPLVRGWTLFNEYFPRFYPPFEHEFLTSTGLSIEEYYICLSAIITNFMNPNIGTGIFKSDTREEPISNKDVLQKFTALESQTVGELRDALWGKEKIETGADNAPSYDYRPLREKPIVRANDNRAIILDPVFFSEKAFIGPLFHLLGKNTPRDKANNIFNAFGKAFESYSCDILKRIFPDTGSNLVKRLTCNIRETDSAGNVIEIDACLNDVTEMVLFEMKAVWIRENEILTEDYESYLQHLKKKYVTTEGTSGDRKIKGIGQLARTINILASRNGLGQNKEYSEIQFIYPVLIVHDPLMHAPAYGNFLASEFKTLLAPDIELQSGELKKGRFRIAPLILMTVEDLENLETSVEHFALRDFLADYSRYCRDRLMSLHDFIAYSPYAKQFRHNQTMVDKGLEILRKTGEALFPQDGGQSD